jgi:broad specificity phosphatase PhoE
MPSKAGFMNYGKSKSYNMKLIAVRHGITELNKEGRFNGRIDEPLTPEGEAHAGEICAQLPKGIEKIVASDMLRTRQTAQIIGDYLNLSIAYSPEIREVDLGSFNGKNWEEMSDIAHRDIFDEYRRQQYDFREWGGESADEVRTRISAFIETLKQSEGNSTVLLVTHGGIIRTLHFLFKHELMGEIGNLSIHEFDL